MDAFTETYKIMNDALKTVETKMHQHTVDQHNPDGECWNCAHYICGMCHDVYPAQPQDAHETCDNWRAF